MRPTRHPWSEAETDFLESIAEAQPMPDIVRRYNRMALRRGWHSRTQHALALKINRLNLSTKPLLDQMSIGTLATMLGIDRSRIRSWISAHGLPAKVRNPTRCAIALSDVRCFARAHPQRFYGIAPDCLEWVGINPASVSATRARTGAKAPVRRLDTNVKFSSITEAAQAHYLHPRSLMNALKQNRCCAGIQFERID